MNKLILTLLIGTSSIYINAQTTWYEIDVPTENKLNDIDFPSNLVGYIAADSGVLLKTTDGGQIWEDVIYTGIDESNWYNLVDIDFVTENTGFVITGPFSPTVYKTIDGGTTWSDISAPFTSVCYKSSLFALDSINTFLGGAGCFQSGQIEQFNDGTWSIMSVNYESFNTDETVLSIDFFDDNYGLAAMRGQFMLRTMDGGSTWDTIPTGISAAGHLTSVDIIDELVAYAGYDENGGGFGILKTVDGGLTWEQDLGSATFYYPAFLSVAHSNNGDVYSGAVPSNSPGGLIFEQTAGNMWDYYPVDQAIYSMDGYGEDVMFGVGDSGYVVVNTPLNELSILDDDNSNVIEVSPNPATNTLNINHTNVSATIQILSMDGRTVYNGTLQNQHESIDVSGFESGTYLLYSNILSNPVKFIKL